jgi:hypothetical protein
MKLECRCELLVKSLFVGRVRDMDYESLRSHCGTVLGIALNRRWGRVDLPSDCVSAAGQLLPLLSCCRLSVIVVVA